MAPPTSIGAGEGALNLIAWEGYTDTSWVKPFTAATGCKVNAKYAGSSDEMVTLMAGGGGGQWDMVSASGDADLRLIYGGDVKPMNPDLIPDFGDFQTYFKTPGYNTINGIHYGISLQWGPNVLLYNTKKFPIAPTSWSVLYDPANKGLITVPDNPIQIADAALYLMSKQPSLGIKDPYELKQNQFDAAIALLKTQRPLVKKYWPLAGDEIQLFANGDVQVGAAWPYQTITLQAAKKSVADSSPRVRAMTRSKSRTNSSSSGLSAAWNASNAFSQVASRIASMARCWWNVSWVIGASSVIAASTAYAAHETSTPRRPGRHPASDAGVGGDRYRFAPAFVLADDVEALMVCDDRFHVSHLVARYDDEPCRV